MNIKLHKFLQRKQISNLATAVANAKVDGVKVRAVPFLRVLASLAGFKSHDEFLQDIDAKQAEAFTLDKKEVMFDYSSSSEGKLVRVVVEPIINGHWIHSVGIHDGIIGANGYIDRITVRGMVDGGLKSDSGLSAEQVNEYRQITLNYLFDLASWLNEHKTELRASDFDDSWTIVEFGEHKPNRD